VKVVILAGGFGTRISEETTLRPKPLVEIGGRPILWHIMKLYGAFGFNEFIVCLGYKGYLIKEFFSNYYLHSSDVTFDIASNDMVVHESVAEPWKVTLLDTGETTMTGGRLKRIAKHLNNETFCMTYGDGLASVDIADIVRFHKAQGCLATVTVVQPQGRFGAVDVVDGRVVNFREKPAGDNAWVSGGFFVLEPRVLDLIADDATVWEAGPMEALASMHELSAYYHDGFWHALDTLRDKNALEELWRSGSAPWKSW
jgi:glucose-1-phosphate cytidylyltransferase